MFRSPIHKSLLFTGLAFFFSWTPWFYVIFSKNPPAPELTRVLIFSGAFAPMLAALLLWQGAPVRLRNLFSPKAPLWVYALALLGIPLVVALLRLCLPLDTPASPYFGQFQSLCLSFLILIPVVLGEELGWRGYLFPCLLQKFSFMHSSLLVGLIWAVWHFPLFFTGYYPNLYNSHTLTLTLFTMQILCASVYYSWLFQKSGQRLLIPCILHAANNSFAVAAVVPNNFSSWQQLQVWSACIGIAFLLCCFLYKIEKKNLPCSLGNERP